MLYIIYFLPQPVVFVKHFLIFLKKSKKRFLDDKMKKNAFNFSNLHQEIGREEDKK